ncbi:MAG: hypothetical protein O7H41_02655 [Planctomycetota bacterium]|nr:hypothetical protein [Planctomycetota bacterium]
MVHLQPEGPDLIPPPGRWPRLELGSILYKEFVVAGRRWPTYAWRAAGLAILGLSFILTYADSMRAVALGHGAADRVGRELLSGIALITFGVVTLSMPASVVRGFVEEKDRGTLGLLLASPLGEWRVVAGKVLAALMRTAVWTMGIVPLLFGLLSFRGIEPGAIPAVLSTIAAGGMLAGGVALLTFSLRTSAPIILIRMYLILIAYTIILPFITDQVIRGPVPLALAWAPWMVWNPFFCCLDEINLSRMGWPQLLGPWQSLLVGIAFLVAATAVFARRLAREQAAPGRAVRVPRRRPMGGRSPILWYETTIRGQSHRRSRAWTAAIGILITALFGTMIAIQDGQGFGWFWFILGMGTLVLLLIEVVVRGAWTGGDPRTELPLAVTPLSARRIAAEKIAAVCLKTVPGMIFVMVAFSLAVMTGDDLEWNGGDIPLLVGCLILSTIGFASLSALLARWLASSTRGTAAALGVILTTAIAVPLFFEIARVRDYELLAGATDPAFFVGRIFNLGWRESIKYGAVALIHQSIWVAGIFLFTIYIWGPLTRRHA